MAMRSIVRIWLSPSSALRDTTRKRESDAG
jgi:hypothetical protein